MLRVILSVVATIGVAATIPATAQQNAQKSAGPRVPLVQDDTADPDAQALFKELRSRGTSPLNLHRTYSNAPKLARASLAVAQALRYDAIVARADKELIILRATQLARGDYQFGQHRRLAISCGITEEQIASLPKWRESKLFSDRQRAVLAFADGMASPDGVDDATFDAMRAYYSNQEIVELTMNAAYYVASSYISRTLRITAEGNPKGGAYGVCK
jgi:alkylhydroperoxidase family enzyme